MGNQVRLKNMSGGVRGFFGAQSISKQGKVPGLRIAPNEVKVLLPEQVEALKDPKGPHGKILQHYLRVGDLVDMDETFTDDAASSEAEAAEAPADEQVAGSFIHQEEVTTEQKVAAYVALTEEKALAAVLDEADLHVLEAWFKAETRETVKAQINTRGQYIVNQANVARKAKG